MKKKIIYFSTLFILSFFLLFIIYNNNTYSKFSSANVKDTIATLSSRTFSGRLAGSDENSFTSEYIKNKFIKYDLQPFKKSYIDSFDTTCPVPTNTTPYLKINNSNGECTKEFKYGVDFKEDMINFKSNTFSFSNADNINIMKYNIQIKCSDGKLLLYVPSDDKLTARSSFSGEFTFDSVAMITSNTYNEIVDSLKNGNTISLHVPFKNEVKSLNNVVAMIKGTNSSLAPLVITAHFDHLGVDGAGTLYGGALDNASGTSFILELARSFNTFAKPKRDIIFVALNAEELGLLGSKDFAEKNVFYLKNSKVINFDMIGSADTPISFMQGTKFKNANSDLLNSIQKICKDEGVSYNVLYQDSSDHASFNNLNIDALTFCHSDLSKIHTPADTIDYIDCDSIDNVYKVVESEIKSYCYSPLVLALYNPYIVFILSAILGIMVAWVLFDKKNTILTNKSYKILSAFGIVISIIAFLMYIKGFTDSIIIMIIFIFANIICINKNASKEK